MEFILGFAAGFVTMLALAVAYFFWVFLIKART